MLISSTVYKNNITRMATFSATECGGLRPYETHIYKRVIRSVCSVQVSSQSAGRGDGALGGPEAGNRSAEEEAGRAGGETHGQGPGAGQVRRSWDAGKNVH